jgi:tetratricopeptide (TPR) repeat protein
MTRLAARSRIWASRRLSRRPGTRSEWPSGWRNNSTTPRAYLCSLDITTRLEDRRVQAATLVELGNLSAAAGRLEESAGHFRHAADLYAAIGDQSSEGVARSNLAACLHGLQRYATARVEAERAIELTRELGHAAKPWTPWAIVSEIERDLGNTEAAVVARRRAIDTYAAYRRDGGYRSRHPASS